MKRLDKHFGKFGAIFLLTSIFISNALGLNLSHIKAYRNLNNYVFTLVCVLFFVIQFYYYYKNKMSFKLCFLLLLFNLQILIITKFLYMVDIDNTQAEISLLDKNAAISMSWIILVPLLFTLFFIMGSIFDYISLKSLKNNFSQQICINNSDLGD
ncbi:MAG: hypothetical protein CR968_02425 [Flavobacteriia bacterium]|nr:MAG: hypothetical protein CR968_02425 [Flavobacteriia bacterium]